MRTITLVPDAWEHYQYWQGQDKKTLKRINTLINEPLRGDLSGYWSRRIDDVNRLVYRATDSELIVIACRFHYDG